MPKKIEHKMENGVLLKREYWGESWSTYTPKFEMVTDRREAWGFDVSEHPKSTISCTRIGSRYNEDTPVCPHCSHHLLDVWDYGISPGDYAKEVDCPNCEEAYLVEANFPGGYSSKAISCRDKNKPHEWVFGAQYYYKCDRGESSTWRNFVCLHCDDSWNNVQRENLRTLLPWRDEYSDPEYFDPDGVLDTGMDRDELHGETPILDALFSRQRHWNRSARWDQAIHHLDKAA